MKPLVCIYCEGSDVKVAVITKERDRYQLLRTADFDVFHPKAMQADAVANLNFESNDISLMDMDKATDGSINISNEGLLNSALSDIKLTKCDFIPAITEPAIHYHVYEGPKDSNLSRLQDSIIDEIQKSKNVLVPRDNIGFTELDGGSLLSVFVDGEIQCINLVNSLAQHNNRRYYKIPSVKSAEITLTYYVAKKKKFFPDDYSLIVYIGKEYSKLIFLHGRKLKHIGTTLDVGTINLHTYDVYFSKILLEMENGGIPRLDNVVLCGEDDSENLILSFYGTFPEANVSRLEFDDLDISLLDEAQKSKISSFSVPIATAYEYIDELNKAYHGINLLPRYVKEEQKFFQFGWHSYILLPILFAVALFFTYHILTNNKQINILTRQVNELKEIQRQNQKILGQINYFENRIVSFDATKIILDSASAGAEVWGKMTENMARFIGSRKSMWINSIGVDQNKTVAVSGFGLSRSVLTEFADSYNTSLLKNIRYEPLRTSKAYKFELSFDLLNLSGGKK
ncbi:MAG: hypothetical protein NTX22_07685 [Ignavibacteriales bacterium]|nr:hypothetical protein [Ignavibacteriales bacterium]